MSTVLIYTSPARGHLYPIMDVALGLRDAGHRVVVQTLAAERASVEATGIEHRPIAPPIEEAPLQDYRTRGTKAQFEAALSAWADRAPHEVDDLRAAIDEVRPDALIVDANTWGAAALAEASGLPWSLFMPYCLPVPSHDAPAFGPGFAPPKNGFDRLRDRVVWGALGAMARPSIRRLNALRNGLGVPPLDGLPALYTRPDTVLYRTAEPFEYSRGDWPAGVKLLGPGLWSPPAEAPDWLDDLPHPRVLVSVSTEMQGDGAIIEAALEGLSEEPGSIIVTTSALDPATFEAPHDRTRIVKFVPHSAVMDKVDVVVTHGGMGTTQRALAAGVPIVVIPWGRDQSESARRVEHCGAGVMLTRSKLTAERLRDAVRDARGKADAAGRVATAFAEVDGARSAVEIVEASLAESMDAHQPRE